MKPGILLCLDFDLNAYKDIKLQPSVELLRIHHHSFTKTQQGQRCLCLRCVLMDQIIATWIDFFQVEVNFFLLFFIFYSRVWFICYNYVHFFIVRNTNSQHFQVLYFVSISTAEGPLILPSVNQSLFQMSLLNELLSSLLQVGQLYAQQGAVREAFRQFVDGLTLARHFALPYRYSL